MLPADRSAADIAIIEGVSRDALAAWT